MHLWALVLSEVGLLIAAAAPAPALPGASSKDRGNAASWDEVNVLAHGLLQLGHGLKEHVERTRGHLRELGSRLSLHNASLALLERRADEQQQFSRAQRLLDDRLADLSGQLRALLGDLTAHKAAVRERLERLDGRLRQAGVENGSGSPRVIGPPAELGALQVRPDLGSEGGRLP